jgi:hypothetical protein
MTLELVPLCVATVSLAEPINVSSSLMIGEVTAMEVVGERITASLKGRAAADWLQISPSGFGTLDVKVTLETNDGALIHATYSGRLQFDTGTVSKGKFSDGKLIYEMFELR